MLWSKAFLCGNISIRSKSSKITFDVETKLISDTYLTPYLLYKIDGAHLKLSFLKTLLSSHLPTKVLIVSKIYPKFIIFLISFDYNNFFLKLAWLNKCHIVCCLHNGDYLSVFGKWWWWSKRKKSIKKNIIVINSFFSKKKREKE